MKNLRISLQGSCSICTVSSCAAPKMADSGRLKNVRIRADWRNSGLTAHAQTVAMKMVTVPRLSAIG